MFYVVRKTPKVTWIQESAKIKDLNKAERYKGYLQETYPKHFVFIVAMVEDM